MHTLKTYGGDFKIYPVLNLLQSIDGNTWYAKKQSIAVVKSAHHKRMDQGFCRYF